MGSGEAAGGGGGGGGSGSGSGGSSNSSGDALVTRISSLLRDLPTLKAAVIVACAFSAFLIACLLLRVFRSRFARQQKECGSKETVTIRSKECVSWSGKRLKKTRKYDIITTPAERVEMAPLNEEDDEDEDSTVFDIKYSVQMWLMSWTSGPPWFITGAFCDTLQVSPEARQMPLFLPFV
ncbi:hypothetical protein EI555_019370 [Monodon monoceros]|uniref:Membrane protein FAM174B n=1 Tax=Monodon monoceros TaxID=40151 RepID=A0A4U1FIG1_MONMO|nr:hypothetical protein EI555_019370 [Monodon monoceros]